MGDNYSFEIVSRKFGRFTAVAPERFRAEIEKFKWHVGFDATRSVGRQFCVVTTLKKVRGKHQNVMLLHVLIWRLMGKGPVLQIDHVDGQPLNNGETNLRDGTEGVNARNRRSLSRNNKSGVNGVAWVKSKARWMASICVDGKCKNLGCFVELERAKAVRKAAVIKHYGEAAVLKHVEVSR